MARPRKNSNTPDAREALLEAFWKLLEEHTLHDISISMITSLAGYNRGTFYYHFADKEALVTAAVENELRDVPRFIFESVTGLKDLEYKEVVSNRHVTRIALFMRQGDRNGVERKVKDYIVGMWSALLSPEKNGVTSQTRIILEYMTSGVLAVISYITSPERDDIENFPASFLREYSRLAMSQICEAQHLSQDELVSRLGMLSQIAKVNNGR